MIKTLIFSNEYFSPKDTLECGQIFRYFKLCDNEYLVISKNKPCILKEEDNQVFLTFNSCDEQYFYNYFDLATDYNGIYQRAIASKYQILAKSAKLGKGVRILKQDSEETLFSFLISQNNNIPRIKNSLNKICELLGEKGEFCGYEYYSFPTLEKLLSVGEEFYKNCGLGYRAEYILIVANQIKNGLLTQIKHLSQEQVKQRLMQIKGIGEKVADCALLFGFNYTKSFPVDTWIEKIYREDFNGALEDRKKITKFFTEQFGLDSGYFQQYLFYFKRTLSKKS